MCRSNVEDPYLQLGDSEDESELEDMTFRDTDLVILGARNEDDVSHLEVPRSVAVRRLELCGSLRRSAMCQASICGARPCLA